MSNPKDDAFINNRRLRPESLMMSYGYHPQWSEGAMKCPIFQTSTFTFETAEEGKAFFEVAYGLREQGPNETLGLIYSRLNNPDLEILEDRLTLWDGAEAAAVFESGMAAISTTLLHFLRPGELILHSEPVYGGTDYLLNHILPEFDINSVRFNHLDDPESLQSKIDENGGAERLKIIYMETPANPTNKLVDIQMCAGLARENSTGDNRVLLVVDNTFLGPLWQQPLRHGADLVIYSATKFIGGHSDVIAGVCLGEEALIKEVQTLRTILGTMGDPWTGWLLMRSLETLKVRMQTQTENARTIARFLDGHPKVEKVYYLDLLQEDDPQYQIYQKQCTAPGSMITFDIIGGEEEAFRFLNSLELIHLAVSLGGTESLAEHPATMTHSDITPVDQERMGITPQMVRLSIGIEDSDDLMFDLDQAFDKV